MKYIIPKGSLMKTMKFFMDKHIGKFELPLHIEKSKGQGNKGWGSKWDDYTYVNVRYFTDELEDNLFTKFDDNYIYSDCKWQVNEVFEPLYNFFGEQNFEDFIQWHFGFNIRDKRGKDCNWNFWTN